MRPLPARASERSGTLAFGPLAITAKGLEMDRSWILGRRFLPWDEVERVAIEDGAITVRRKGRWLRAFRCRVADVPNVFVLEAMLRTLRPGILG